MNTPKRGTAMLNWWQFVAELMLFVGVGSLLTAILSVYAWPVPMFLLLCVVTAGVMLKRALRQFYFLPVTLLVVAAGISSDWYGGHLVRENGLSPWLLLGVSAAITLASYAATLWLEGLIRKRPTEPLPSKW